ncbi:SapC family protein [Trichloromonas sp.]|uniref:SapC family protein n=1 Tax=Trichloromonas sp. TaxID=3069249 RepID=UPI002A3771F7|nr:SapC family protein [Trichloromonas sp.]
MANIVPISVETHAGKKIQPLTSYAFAKKINSAPVVASEIAIASRHFPLAFIEQNGEVGLFALFGLLNQQNLFVDANGRWLADYVPAILRRYPFIFAKARDREDYILCVDEDSGLISEKKGAPLFEDNGEASETLKKALAFVTEYQRAANSSMAFSAEVKRLSLLQPLNIELKISEDKKQKIEGLQRIDEKRLNALSEEDFLALRTKGFLPLIYAHLFSLNALGDLGRRLGKPAPKVSKSSHKKDELSLPDTFKF